MGHERPYLKQPWKSGDFEVFTIIFFAQVARGIIIFRLAKSIFGV